MEQIYDLSGFSLNESFLFPNVTFDILDFANRDEIDEAGIPRQPLPTVITMTLVYTILLLTGVTGNVSTCIVIARNRYMHTATNYYLFSLAISDLLLLVMGLPQELYQLWVPYPYMFGEVLCILRGFTAETSTNASILTITAFTVERYVAICHPLKSHTMSKLSRAVKTILAIWAVAAVCAIPLSLQFGVIYRETAGGDVIWETALCALKRPIKHAFAISTFLFFGGPMGAITVLYMKIAIRLRRSGGIIHRDSEVSGSTKDKIGKRRFTGTSVNRRGIVKMLVAVVVSFFLCWSPFHAQRLMAIYIREPTYIIRMTYMVLTYISGITYYLSATVNPILYQVMSLKFQQAFKDTFGPFSKCLKGDALVASSRIGHEHSISAASTRIMRINMGSESRKISSAQ